MAIRDYIREIFGQNLNLAFKKKIFFFFLQFTPNFSKTFMKFLDLQSRQKIVSFSILFFQDKKMSEKQVKIRRLDRMLFPPFSFENTTIMKINDPKGQVVCK